LQIQRPHGPRNRAARGRRESCLRGADGEELLGGREWREELISGRGAARTARSWSAARSVRDDPATEGTLQQRGAAGASVVAGSSSYAGAAGNSSMVASSLL
jgi:hypothetical protein